MLKTEPTSYSFDRQTPAVNVGHDFAEMCVGDQIVEFTIGGIFVFHELRSFCCFSRFEAVRSFYTNPG
jgi:hypothetical protein